MGLLNYDPNQRLTAQQVHKLPPFAQYLAAAQAQLEPLFTAAPS